MKISKKYYNDIATIDAIGVCIDNHYKQIKVDGKYAPTTYMAPRLMAGCLLFFTEASNNWCKSKLNLSLSRAN